jgi:tRNA (guanine10-N2)-dimethyltransferase
LSGVESVYLTGSIFVLSGEELSLPSAEIRALVETYAPEEKVELLSSRVIRSTLDDSKRIDRISKRAAYCRFGGMFLAAADTPKDLIEAISTSSIDPGGTFVVSSETLERPLVGEVGALIKARTSARVSLEDPDNVFQAEQVDRGFVLAVTRGGFKNFSWRQRRPRARKFFLPSAIYPKLACSLVNLSRVKEGEVFLDPFCGTGSLLIESSVMGIRTVGSDLTRWIARGALLNLKGFSLDFEGILRCDATSDGLPFRNVDGISTDVPYGRASSTKGKSTENIVKEFTHAAAEALTKGRGPKHCVVMHPSHLDFEFERSAFELAERHFIYVHRNLTRAISVLRSRDSGS